MNAGSLVAKFARLGVRLKLSELMGKNPNHRPLTLDVRADDDGEFYDIWTRADADVDLDVVDLRRRERHLLLGSWIAVNIITCAATMNFTGSSRRFGDRRAV